MLDFLEDNQTGRSSIHVKGNHSSAMTVVLFYSNIESMGVNFTRKREKT